jgi:hypothetical protein
VLEGLTAAPGVPTILRTLEETGLLLSGEMASAPFLKSIMENSNVKAAS